jgi:Methyltransferase domain
MRRAQNQIHTHMFRRTDVLRTARAQLLEKSDKLKILSFGCSLGDELVTLRYIFPDADILGCEIDPMALEIAQKTVGHLATVFESDASSILERGPFDLIVCSAVLCLNPPKKIRAKFPSARFDELLALLDAALSPSGLLCITNASYRFQNAPVFSSYDPIRSDIVSSTGFVDVFTHEGESFLEKISLPSQYAYRRGPGFSLTDDEEMADCIFRKREAGEAPAVGTLRLAPVPERFEPEFEFKRSNLETLDASSREDAIEVVRHYKFGRDAADGTRGYVIQVSWGSLAGSGEHVRLPTWNPLEEFPSDQ